MERTDENGTWLVQDDGSELLIEPSQQWIDAHPPVEMPSDPLRSAVVERMTDPAVNSIAKIKAALVTVFTE
jgi:hypothetical protein